MTRAELGSIDAAADIECPTFWTRTTDSGEEEVVASLLVVDGALRELSYEDGWTTSVLADDVTELESFTAAELAAHSRLRDTLDVPHDRFDMYRNESSRPVA